MPGEPGNTDGNRLRRRTPAEGEKIMRVIKGPRKERISITLDGYILETLKKQAEADDRTLSQYINRILRQALEAEEAGA